MFPSVGAVRRTGTTVIIEDVAFPVARLAPATDLQALLREHGYSEAIIFGHALEGNLHFVREAACTASKSMDDRPASSAEQQASFLDRGDWS
jgi:FAD/FMN-containing dehydrogenase